MGSYISHRKLRRPANSVHSTATVIEMLVMTTVLYSSTVLYLVYIRSILSLIFSSHDSRRSLKGGKWEALLTTTLHIKEKRREARLGLSNI